MNLKKLKDLDAKQNNGHGVPCVKAIIDLLERGDAEAAKNLAQVDHYKLKPYRKICEELTRLQIYKKVKKFPHQSHSQVAHSYERGNLEMWLWFTL